MGLAGIVIEPSADLLRLQQKLIDAVAPFSERGGTSLSGILCVRHTMATERSLHVS